MAREEEPREDLLREATALVARAELQVENFAEPVVAGFRRDGAASFFFGQQRVYQFNATGELRRGFLNDQLYKAECGRLVRLARQRTQHTVELLRHELNDAETAYFLTTALEYLQRLRRSLEMGTFHAVGQVPPEEDVVGRISDWLARRSEAIQLADSPKLA
jgi:hypothetical protein